MKIKKFNNIFLILVLFLGILCFKNNTVYAIGNWKTMYNGDWNVYDGYSKYGDSITNMGNIQAWHYNGTYPYWKITDMTTTNYATVYDSDIDSFLNHYTWRYASCLMDIPSDVLANIKTYGEDSLRVNITGNSDLLDDGGILWYRVNGSQLEIQFSAKLLSSGNFWQGRPGFVTLPQPLSGYGENAFSVFDLHSNTHIGGVFTNSFDPPIYESDIYIDGNGDGRFYTDFNYTIWSTESGGWITYNSQKMRIGINSFSHGGAQGAVYYYPFDVQFYTKNDPIPPSGVTVKYVDAATNADISSPDNYADVTPGEQTYTAKDIPGYTLNGDKTQTITVEAGQSYTVTFKYDKVILPEITLNCPSTAVAGDDVGLSATSSSKDPKVTSLQNTIIAGGATEGSPILGDVVNFSSGTTNKSATTYGSVSYKSLGTYNVTAGVVDSLGNSASVTKQISIIKPTPVVRFTQTGALKENRKVVIDMNNSYAGSMRSVLDWTKAKYTVTALDGSTMNDVRIQSHTSGSTNGTVLYDPSQEINQSLDGSKIFDMTFKKAGKYLITCTLTNDYDVSSTSSLTLDIIEDKHPIAGFSVPTTYLRDQSDPNKFGGLNYSTIKLNDSGNETSGNYSTDGDTIGNIAWFYIFDSNDNGSYLDDKCYVYNSSTAQWLYVGTYANIATFDVDSVPVGALRNIYLDTPHVGDYYFGAKIREAFGEEYIPQFVTILDRKTTVIFN